MKTGLAVYSIRSEMEKNPAEALKKVAKAGYKHIEMANGNPINDHGYGFNMSVNQLKGILDETGLEIIGTHACPLDESIVYKLLDFHQKVGSKRLVLAIDFFKNRDDVLKKCELYNRIGKMCRDAGMSFYYHNHFLEFQKFEGECVFDTIIKNTDPELLYFELDPYWTFRSGVSTIEYMKKLGKRFKLLHLKDFPKDPSLIINMFDKIDKDAEITAELFDDNLLPEEFIEFGQGIMDYQQIIDEAKRLGVEYAIIEQDETKLNQIESVTASINRLKNYKNLDF